MTQPVRRAARKVCLLGDFSVGKTSLVRRFVESRFDERYLSTIGVKVDRKVERVSGPDGDVELTLLLWDLAGGPDTGPVSPRYYEGAAGALLVCDLTRPETLEGLERYAERLLRASPASRLVLAANKVDLVEERRVDDEHLASAAARLAAPLFRTSARTGEQVEEMLRALGLLLAGGGGQ